MPDKSRVDVFISSTIIDLPEYRRAVEGACLSLGLFPDAMEHWPLETRPQLICVKKRSIEQISSLEFTLTATAGSQIQMVPVSQRWSTIGLPHAAFLGYVL